MILRGPLRAASGDGRRPRTRSPSWAPARPSPSALPVAPRLFDHVLAAGRCSFPRSRALGKAAEAAGNLGPRSAATVAGIGSMECHTRGMPICWSPIPSRDLRSRSYSRGTRRPVAACRAHPATHARYPKSTHSAETLSRARLVAETGSLRSGSKTSASRSRRSTPASTGAGTRGTAVKTDIVSPAAEACNTTCEQPSSYPPSMSGGKQVEHCQDLQFRASAPSLQPARSFPTVPMS